MLVVEKLQGSSGLLVVFFMLLLSPLHPTVLAESMDL